MFKNIRSLLGSKYNYNCYLVNERWKFGLAYQFIIDWFIDGIHQKKDYEKYSLRIKIYAFA